MFLRDVRSSDFAQIFACGLIGLVVGGVTGLLHRLVEWLHVVDFGLEPGQLLSNAPEIPTLRLLLVPAIGGIVLGGSALLFRRRFATNIVDPVEANALHGGRMSIRASLRLLAAAVISNAAGASLGMEAAYSQMGAALFSWLGRVFRLRRADLRMFVTAGAGAAIAAAFNAPLAGAFYGYELVLGSYIPRALAPVAVAALAANLAGHAFGSQMNLFAVHDIAKPKLLSYVVFVALGVGAAFLSILSMRAVTWCERGFRLLRVPAFARPVVGGLVLSFIALGFPQALGGGHGGIQYHFDHIWAFIPVALLLLAKFGASAVSISSGYRGGMFSSSIFLGALFGAAAAQIAGLFIPGLAEDRAAIMLVSMGAVAAGIVGAPMTMVFLVLEGTGNFGAAVDVMVGVVVSSTIVRDVFGYSFSTWRFHERGLSIRGGHDVGWLADMTVGTLMRRDPIIVSTAMPLKELRNTVPVGGQKFVLAMDSDGHFAGVVDMARAHDAALNEALDTMLAGDLTANAEAFLRPSDNVRDAFTRFASSRQEMLPVIHPHATPEIVGYLTEAYAQRRYIAELERRRSAELGDENLFSIGQPPPN